jgi:hypothetical protein
MLAALRSCLSVVVVLSSYTLAIAELAQVNIDGYALASGIALFVIVLCLRMWSWTHADRFSKNQTRV